MTCAETGADRAIRGTLAGSGSWSQTWRARRVGDRLRAHAEMTRRSPGLAASAAAPMSEPDSSRGGVIAAVLVLRCRGGLRLGLKSLWLLRVGSMR